MKLYELLFEDWDIDNKTAYVFATTPEQAESVLLAEYAGTDPDDFPEIIHIREVVTPDTPSLLYMEEYPA